MPSVNQLFKTSTKETRMHIQRFYKKHKYSAAYMGYDHPYAIIKEGTVIGSVIVSYISEDNHLPLLHALFISENYRGLGLSKLVIKELIKEHQKVICFADDTFTTFYTKLGFQKAQKNKIPTILLKNYQSYLRKNNKTKIFILLNHKPKVYVNEKAGHQLY